MGDKKSFLVEADTDFFAMFIWSTKPGPSGAVERDDIVFTSSEKNRVADYLKTLLITRSDMEKNAPKAGRP